MNVGHTGIEWSPDGQVIAVWGFADESATNTGIWLVPVDGSAPRLLATLSEMMPELVGGGGHMDWSPDSTKLALLGDRIHLIGSDGTEDLIEGDFVSSISWSPDGQLLAVTSEKGVTLLSPANSQEEHLVIDHRGEVVTNAGFYTWSPDGLSLLVRVSSEETSAIVSVPINPGEPETAIYEWPNGNLELEGIDWQGLSK
jgi:WD40 repeat protein